MNNTYSIAKHARGSKRQDRTIVVNAIGKISKSLTDPKLKKKLIFASRCVLKMDRMLFEQDFI